MELSSLNWRKSSRSVGDDRCVEVAAWHKSSRCTNDGECVEVDAWRKSSRSTNDDECVEVAELGGGVAVRDSKNPGPALLFSPGAWHTFTGTLKTT